MQYLNHEIAQKAKDGPSSLQTRLSRPKGLKKWIKHLHGTMWIMFQSLLDIILGSLKSGACNPKLRMKVSN